MKTLVKTPLAATDLQLAGRISASEVVLAYRSEPDVMELWGIRGNFSEDPDRPAIVIVDGSDYIFVRHALPGDKWWAGLQAFPPTRGDKLYRYNGTQMETVTFLEQGLADASCSAPTWLVRDDKVKSRCSIGFYARSESEAYERHLKELRESIPWLEEHIREARLALQNGLNEIEQTEKALKLLSWKLTGRAGEYRVWSMDTSDGKIFNVTKNDQRPDSDAGYFELGSLLMLKGVQSLYQEVSATC